MAKKKKNWFQILKKLFVSESKPKPEKKEKKKRWFFGRFKFKRLPPVVVPSKEEKTLSEIEEDHCKHALTVAIATAAAAEAAVAASQAAAEILRLTRTPKSYLRTKSRRLHDSSAIKIQTAFRGYLARKALRALKGLVKLQAMVRGRAVRRQAITSLKGLQCLVRIQSQIRERRIRMAESSPIDADKKQFLQPNKELIKMNTQRKHNDDPSSSEGCDSIVLSRQGSLIRRKQVKQEKNIDYVLHSYPSYREMERQTEHKTTDLSEDEKLRDLSSSISLRRRSFDKQSRCFIGENDTFTSSSSSSSIPNYMSATESAKAKSRLNSTANQRHGYSESCSDFYSSASKNRLSFSSASNDFIVPPKPPRMKSLSVSLKSRSILKDLSTDSDRSMLILNQQSCLSDFQQNGNQRL